MDQKGNIISIDTAGDDAEAQRLMKAYAQVVGKLENIPEADVEHVQSLSAEERKAWLARRQRNRKKQQRRNRRK